MSESVPSRLTRWSSYGIGGADSLIDGRIAIHSIMKLDLKHKAYQITPDGTITEVAPDNGKDFKLAELYRHTNCDCVERAFASFDETGMSLGPFRSPQVWMDENGKLKADQQYNLLATRMLYGLPVSPHGDRVVGTVLVCPAKMVK